MKIFQIGCFPLNSNLIKGGVEASVYGLAVEQCKDNQVSVIDIPRADIIGDYTEEIEGVCVYRFLMSGKQNYSAIFRLRTILPIIRKENPDICHIHSTSLFCFLLYLLLRFYRFKLVVTVHGLTHIEKKNLWQKQHSIRNLIKYTTQSFTEFLFLSICPLIIVDTHYVAEAIKSYKKEAKIFKLPKCDIIPQGVNGVFFHLNKSIIKNQLISVGAINKRKGHSYLIEAMKKVKAQVPEVTLFIVGVLSDSVYYQLLQKSFIENNLENQIKILPNASFDVIQSLLSSSDIFILHSEEESQGIVFCEAMAAGKAIVATNVGGIPFVVENNVNGLLSDFGDIDTFANNVITLLQNDSLREKMEESNRIKAHNYEWRNISKEISKVYDSL